MIDVIIPVLNEEDFLTKHSVYYETLKQKANVIFVDGGSGDRTVEVANHYGKVITSSRNRARQKNEGAAAALSNYLFFANVDSFVDMESLRDIEEVLSNGTYGGCFTMSIDDPRLVFRVFERFVNLRARVFKVLDGDLGQFVRKDVFRQVGGYDQVAIMEDILFGKKLKKIGKVTVLPYAVKVSSRRWHEKGFCKTLFQYIIAYVRLWTGNVKH